ncbi:MAG: hypothetical protein ACTSRZ_07435 [Promethearchaeota archaeon]
MVRNKMMKKVVVMYEVFRTICEYSSKYANFWLPKEKWIECMGYLLCDNPKKGDTEYIIRKAIGMASGNEMRVEIPLDELSKVEEIIDQNPGLFIGGWWHTHPGLTVFFSETDVQNQSFYQQHNEDGLGIVFDLEMISEDFIGFKIFRNDTRDSLTYHEVKYELRDFSEEKLKEAFGYLKGIPDWLIHNLCVNYSLKEGELYRFSIEDIKLPSALLERTTDELIEEGYKYDEVANEYFEIKDFEKAIMNMIFSAKCFELANEFESAIDSYIDTIKIIIESDNINITKNINSNDKISTYKAYPIIDKIESILESKEIEAKEYFKGKTYYIRGLVKEAEQNYSLAAELMKKALELYDQEEDFEEIYFASLKIGEYMEKMEQIDDCIKYLQMAKKHAELIFNNISNIDDYSDEIDWQNEISRIEQMINNIKKKKRSPKVERIV